MPNNIINNSHSDSYIADSQVYILGDFSLKEMNELTGNLGNYIFSLPAHPIYDTSAKISSPYNITDIKNPIIDIFIDSCGGTEYALQNLSTLLNIAKSRGAIIRTTVLARAYSAGSLLAIQGTPGFRIMAHDARHMIHFGCISMTATNPDDIEIRARQIAHQKKIIQEKYKKHTKIPTAEFEKMLRCESGYLTAAECLKMGLCDWIISEFGEITNLKESKIQNNQKTI